MTAEVDRPEAASSGSPFTAAPATPDGAPVPAVDAPPATQPVAWRHRHLLDVDALTRPELELVMGTTDAMREVLARPIPKVPALRGTSVTILFYEASTRTRVSFEVAAKNLSADVVNIAAASSSVSKGESLVDTVRTIEALGADMLVMRHPVSGAPYLAAEVFGGAVLNGGDGWHAHPSQALLDLYTLRSRLPGGSLDGRKVVILGDVLHSRVARSNVWSLTAMGADLWICGPSTLLRGFDAWASRGAAGRRFTVTADVDAALKDADVVMALRIQKERMASGLLPSLREYAARYGLTQERLRAANPDVVVMHPGPMNEGVEIAADVAVDPRSVITAQVTNGVAVRMALLYLLAGARAGDHGDRNA
jgi:aspartate carbamoyltransferase catalytic subunit